jgi:CRISPR-associated endonuclease/helicase Cas3
MNPETALHRQLWAKSDPHHFLWRHLLDVAAVAKVLWPRFGPLEAMPKQWACYLCALHDIGKADPWFQNKDNDLAQKLRDASLPLPQRSEATDPDILRFRHEARSFEWLRDALPERYGWDKHAARVVTHAINGHHGNFGADCYSEAQLHQQHATWQPLRDQLAQLVWDVLQPPDYAPPEFQHAGAVGMTLSGLIVLSDWIASNPEIYDYTKLQGHNDPLKYFEGACELAAQVVESLQLNAPEMPVASSIAPLKFADVWPQFNGALRPSQSALQSEVLAGRGAPGLAIIEAPMGEGKTEAAVYLSEIWNAGRAQNGAYIALPAQATSNQMHARYQKFLRVRRPSNAPRLVHGMAWLVDDQTRQGTAQTYGEKDERLLSREWFRPLRRALLAPEGVGTIDQALMAALHVQFGFLRLLGLRSKVLIIDEAHAYDAYMTTILERLVMWCRALQIPVILLSATLSKGQKSKLITAYGGDAQSLGTAPAYPLLTFVGMDGVTREAPVPHDPSRDRTLVLLAHHGLLDDAPAIARLVLERVRCGGCACVLMNSVGGAQGVCQEIERLLQNEAWEKPDELMLFHARFRAGVRADIEEKISRLFGKDSSIKDETRPRRAIVVATQVVEQSLDVDFDFFITQLAPIDLLLQRSGRLWRHEWRDKSRRGSDSPTLEVLWPPQDNLQFGVTEKIYARESLLRTLAVLHGRHSLELPHEFRPLIEAVYGGGEVAANVVPREEVEAAARERHRLLLEDAAKAQLHLLPEPSAREFRLSRRPAGESEESGEAANYFRASTRLGDDSRAALVLHEADLHARAQTSLDAGSKAPHRDTLRRLFANKVNLPAWWLREREAANGYETIFEGQNWLRGHVIIGLRDAEWRSQNGGLLRDDPKLGLLFEAAPKTPKGEEADAGINKREAHK